MRIAAKRQPEVASIARTVIGLRLAAQNRLHDQRLFRFVGYVLQHAVEQARRDDLPQRQLAPECRKIVLEGNELLAAGRLVHPVDHRGDLAFQRLGRSDIGGNHEILDHAVSIKPFAHRDLGDPALLIKHDSALGQFQFQRIPAFPCRFQRAPAGPEVPERIVRLARIDASLRILIGNHFCNADDRTREMPAREPAMRINRQVADHGRAILARPQRTDIGGEHFRQHRHDAVREVDRIAALPCLAVHLTARPHIERDIGDGDDRVEPALAIRFRPDRIVMVACIRRVDGNDRQVPQILALFRAQRQLGRKLGFSQRFFGEDMQNAMLADGDQTERARQQRITQNFGDFDTGARTAPRRLCQHELAGFGICQIGDRRRVPDTAIDRREPALARPVYFDDAQQLLGAHGKLLHRIGSPSGVALLGPGKHPVVLLQCASHALLFDQANPRRRRAVLRRPRIGKGNGLAVLDIDNAQHCDFGQAAHLVISRPASVDQPFVRHVAQQCLELDLLLPLQPESPGNFTLAGRSRRFLDEVEDLLSCRQSGSGLGRPRQFNTPARRKCVRLPACR